MKNPDPLFREIKYVALVLFLMGMIACLDEPNLQRCGDVICPADWTCDDEGGREYCQPPGCGNGIVEAGEVCDGNVEDNVACSANCKYFGTCGNGEVEVGELCDDGNTMDDSECGADCLSKCGNEERERGEACDDGNTRGGDGCSADCQVNENCGNGTIDSGERCDDGNTMNGDSCSANCQIVGTCGNGELEPGEVCDDGNTVSGDGCSADCRYEEA
jgi:cysteine-rich repeat protein